MILHVATSLVLNSTTGSMCFPSLCLSNPHPSSPGSTVGACTKEESFALIAKAINQVHKDVPEVITVIENMVSPQSLLKITV